MSAGNYTDWFKTTNGVRQGDPVGPTCSAIYLNDLLLDLNQNETCILAFADDLVLISNSEKGLQNLINKVSSWCKKWTLSANLEKTNVMHFRNPGKKLTDFSFEWGNCEVSKVESYKYLGVWLDSSLTFQKHCEALADSGGRALGKVLSKFKNFKEICYDTFTKLINTCVDPVVQYGAGVWGFTAAPQIERVQTRAMRFFLGVHPKAQNSHSSYIW